MRKQEIDYIMGKMLEARKEVSDLNITVGRPFQVESYGQLVGVELNPPFKSLTPFQTEMFALNLINGDRRLTELLVSQGSCDASYELPGKARFRVNIFSQRGHYSAVLRKLEEKIPTIEDMKLPAVFHQIAEEKNGIVFVTGATGSGKSTSLAAMLNEINEKKSLHVVTLEDPVEFSHTHKKSTFNQREMGGDFDTYANGLRAALRQAPKVILVGEMRDRESVEIGLNAAETGHLVLTTLHTVDAGQTINRILGMFSTEEENQVRIRLADTTRWVVCQRLLPKEGGGRVAAFEIMGSNLRVKDAILHGESEGKTFYEIIQAGKAFGMITFDDYIVELYREGQVSEETAKAYASSKGIVGRGIDAIKSARGETTTTLGKLEVDDGYGKKPKISPGIVETKEAVMAEKKKILSPVDEELYDAADKPFDFVISEGETALVCESGDAFRKKISDALLKEEYLVTEAESVKDALRKMRFHTYDVIVVNESFAAPQQDANDILRYLENLGMATRRKIFVALITDRFRTMDNMAAFNRSVNMVINTKNMDDVATILQRGISENASFYYVFKETLKKEGRA